MPRKISPPPTWPMGTAEEYERLADDLVLAFDSQDQAALYAGLTLITDRSLEMLGRMPSLEQVEFYECTGVTDAGLVFLAGLPRLREVHVDGLPGVTLEGTRVLSAHVRVKYST